jgi:hypothetical protein
MPSDPTAVPAGDSTRKPTHSLAGDTPDTPSLKLTPDASLDAAAAEPVAHEHLPCRCDDN